MPRSNSGTRRKVAGLAYPGGDKIKQMRRSRKENKYAGRMQRWLKQEGFYDGPLDKKWNLKLKRAIKALQRKKGLTADGIPGPTTWEKAFGWKVPFQGSGNKKYPYVWFRSGVHIPPNDSFMKKLNAVGKEAYEKHGKRLTTISGFRPCGSPNDRTGASTQWGLYKLYRAGRGNLAATPCRSNHGKSTAADTGFEGKNGGGYVSFLHAGSWARELAKKHGLWISGARRSVARRAKCALAKLNDL